MLAIVEVLLQTGMRISELAGLKLDDLDFDRSIVNIETELTRPSAEMVSMCGSSGAEESSFAGETDRLCSVYSRFPPY